MTVAEASGRYPYFVQQFGQETWNVAEGPRSLGRMRVWVWPRAPTRSTTGSSASVETGPTNAEQAYLRAMAQDGDQSSSFSELAARLNRKPASLGPTRASLIAKGLIDAPEYGIVAFTVSGMADFIGRQLDD